jgi:ceramide glucosyltransferase
MLGNLVAEHGHTVKLSSHVIDHCIVNNSFTRNFNHQWNWAKSTRFSRPLGHLGTGLTFAAPFGILGFVAGLAVGKPWLGVGLLALAYLSRVVQSMVVGGWVVRDKEAIRLAWLYPMRDLLGFILWVASYTSRRLGWREDRFVLVKGGLMERI